MNKTVSIIFIIILSIVTILVSSLFVFLLNGNYSISNFSFHFDSSYSDNLLLKEEYESAEEINVDCNTSDILLDSSNNEIITIELYSDNDVEYSITNEDGIINVVLKDKKDSISFFSKQNKVLIRMPKEFDKKMKIQSTTGDIISDSFPNLLLDIHSKTGDIEVDEAKEMIFNHNTGDIKVDKVSVLTGKLSTGDIKVNSIDIIDVTHTTGDIKLDAVHHTIKIDHSIGDIKINKADINENSVINNKTGDIKIGKLSGAYIDAKTNVGDTKINNNDRKLELEIKVTNNIGDIKINN